MKITIDFDITPSEMRRLVGLPDVEAFQKQMMDDIRERMMGGAEGYDPIKLFQPYVAGTMYSWDLFQKMLTGATTGFHSSNTGNSEQAADGAAGKAAK